MEPIDESEALDPFRPIGGFELGRRYPSVLAVSTSSSCLLLRRMTDVSTSLSLTRRSCSYSVVNWVRYGEKSPLSTWVMFVRVTGGISLAVGGLCALEAGAETWGRRPVRTMGGCSNVEIATFTQLEHAQVGYLASRHTILPSLMNRVGPITGGIISSPKRPDRARRRSAP